MCAVLLPDGDFYRNVFSVAFSHPTCSEICSLFLEWFHWLLGGTQQWNLRSGEKDLCLHSSFSVLLQLCLLQFSYTCPQKNSDHLEFMHHTPSENCETTWLCIRTSHTPQEFSKTMRLPLSSLTYFERETGKTKNNRAV